jgi:hypothetical protein
VRCFLGGDGGRWGRLIKQREGRDCYNIYQSWVKKKRLVGSFVGNIIRRKCFLVFNALRSIFCSVRANSALIVTCTTNREVDLTFSFLSQTIDLFFMYETAMQRRLCEKIDNRVTKLICVFACIHTYLSFCWTSTSFPSLPMSEVVEGILTMVG